MSDDLYAEVKCYVLEHVMVLCCGKCGKPGMVYKKDVFPGFICCNMGWFFTIKIERRVEAAKFPPEFIRMAENIG